MKHSIPMFIFGIGFVMQLINFLKVRHRFYSLTLISQTCDLYYKCEGLEALLGYLNKNRYNYEKLIVSYKHISFQGTRIRPLDFLSNRKNIKKFSMDLLSMGIEALHLEITYNISYWQDKKNSEFIKLLNPINYLWNFFDFIYEPMFKRINKYGKTLSNFVGTISTFLTAFYGINIFFEKFGFNIIDFFSKFFMKFF